MSDLGTEMEAAFRRAQLSLSRVGRIAGDLHDAAAMLGQAALAEKLLFICDAVDRAQDDYQAAYVTAIKGPVHWQKVKP